MKKIYFLKTCDTCKKILKDIPGLESFTLQNIKEEPVTEQQLQEMYELSGSYESLFNKRSKLYKELDLKNKDLGKKDYKKYILEHYTFLNRPVILVNGNIFIGNSPKTIQALLNFLSNS